MAKLLRFEHEDRGDGVKSMTGQGNVGAGRRLGDLEGFPRLVGEQVSASNFAGTLIQTKTACGPREEFNIDAIGGGGRTPVPDGDKFWLAVFIFFGSAEASRLFSEESRLRAIDGFAIYGQPFANLVKPLYLGGRDIALRVRSDVQKIVAALACDVDEIAQQCFGGLEVRVVRLISPCVVHGHAGLPISPGIAFRGDVLFRRFGVAFVAAAKTIVPDKIRMLIEQCDDLPGECRRHVRGGSIEPNDYWEVSIVAKELL